MFGYVLCDIKVPNNLKRRFAHFPSIFKNTLIDSKDIGKLMKQNSDEEGLMSQPQKKLISGFELQHGTLITPMLLFYMELGLVCTKIYRFIEHTPKKVVQQICTINCRCATIKWREPKFQCNHWDNEFARVPMVNKSRIAVDTQLQSI